MLKLLFNSKNPILLGYKDPFDNSNKLNYYNTGTQKYEFNILEVFYLIKLIRMKLMIIELKML